MVARTVSLTAQRLVPSPPALAPGWIAALGEARSLGAPLVALP
jgi:hypothetical protein